MAVKTMEIRDTDPVLYHRAIYKCHRLRVLAATGKSRSPSFPDAPTIAESGYPGFQSGIWYGVIAPAGTPPEIIARLNTELVKIVRTPDFLQSLAGEGADPVASTPAYFGDFIKKETARWAKIIKEANIKAN